jgi:hypothetical protein
VLDNPSPASTTSPGPASPGYFLVYPNSAPVLHGVFYDFGIVTHCGLEGAWIDFDGSMWAVTPASAAAARHLGNPDDHGKIEVDDRNPNYALFVAFLGEHLDLERLPDGLEVQVCY